MLNKKEEALLYLKRALRLKPYDEYVRSLIKYNFDEDKIRDIVFAQKPKPFYNDVKSLLLYPFKNVGITR
ncbi:MAG: hypothetical protein N3A65_10120, partial [candidate division WOR-3 bacterium]|nr:hypothetical protein [candidate division WOR-3 bacterium]